MKLSLLCGALLLMSGFALPAHAQSLVNGVVAYYPLDGDGNDASGNGLHGTVHGAISMPDRFGVADAAMNFNGIKNFIDIPPVDFSRSDRLSIQVWLKADQLNSEFYKTFIRQEGPVSRVPDFMIGFQNQGETLYFGLNAGGSYYPEVKYDVAADYFSDGQWHLVVATYDGEAMRIYVDGEEEASLPRSGEVWFDNGWSSIGRMRGKHYFDGGMDEVCYYDRALSPDEVRQIYNYKGLDIHNSSLVSGKVFIDAANACTQDDFEEGIRNRLIEFSPGPWYALSDDNGNFALRLEAGSYTARLMPRDNWRQVCPANDASYPLDIAASDTRVEGLNFGTAPDADICRLEVYIIGAPARPGFQVPYQIFYRNAGTVPFSGRIILSTDPWMEFLRSEPMPDEADASSLVWEIDNLPVEGRGRIELALVLDRTTPLGTRICSEVYSECDRDIQLLGAESDSWCQIVRGSYDPNDIRVDPEGIFKDREQVFSYTIRFQNVGTAAAETVRVLDTLPDWLDIKKLHLGAASHDFSFTIIDNKILSWQFDNINLPDDKSDEPGSHGFIRYRIKTSGDIPVGSAIDNRAAIYFDYNDPVITNTVQSVFSGRSTSVAEQESLLATLSPNPVQTQLLVQLQAPYSGSITIRDFLGRSVARIDVANEQRITVDLQLLSPGSYFVQLNEMSRPVMQRFTILR